MDLKGVVSLRRAPRAPREPRLLVARTRTAMVRDTPMFGGFGGFWPLALLRDVAALGNRACLPERGQRVEQFSQTIRLGSSELPSQFFDADRCRAGLWLDVRGAFGLPDGAGGRKLHTPGWSVIAQARIRARELCVLSGIERRTSSRDFSHHPWHHRAAQARERAGSGCAYS